MSRRLTFRTSFFNNGGRQRGSSINSTKNSRASASRTKGTGTANKEVKLGKDFIQHWDEMDKVQTESTTQIEQLRELVTKGAVSERVYDDIVRETKEKQLGMKKSQKLTDEWVDKPYLQGFLYHRVRNRFGVYKWRKFYFVLYRNKLIWKKKKDSKDQLGSIQLTPNFDLADIQPRVTKTRSRASRPSVLGNKSRQVGFATGAESVTSKNASVAASLQKGKQGKGARSTNIESSGNKHQMRHSFELVTLGNSWQFAAESAALKKYWYHTIGITLTRIIERSQLVDEPVLMTQRAKLASLPSQFAQSVRDRNYRESMVRLSTLGSHASTRPSRKQKGRARRSVEFQEVMNGGMEGESEADRGSTNTKQVIRLQYVHKNAILKNPELVNEDPGRSQADYEHEKPPILEVGEEVHLSPDPKTQHLLPKTRISNLSHLADEEEKGDRITPISKRPTFKVVEFIEETNDAEEFREESLQIVDKELGLKIRSKSFVNDVNMTLEELRQQAVSADRKIHKLETALNFATLQEGQLQEDYEEAKKSGDEEELSQAREARNKAKDYAILQEELMAKASLKKQELNVLIRRKEEELAKAQVTTEIVQAIMQESKRRSKRVIEDEVAKAQEAMIAKEAEAKEVGEVSPEMKLGDDISAEKAALKVYERTRKLEAELSAKTKEVQLDLKQAQVSEEKYYTDEQTAKKLKREAVSKSIELQADELLNLAKQKREGAHKDRETLEDKWRTLVQDGFAARLKAIEVKKLLREKKSSFNVKVEESAAKLTTSNIRPVDSKRALADFIVANAPVAEVSKTIEVEDEKEEVSAPIPRPDDRLNKLSTFLTTQQAQEIREELEEEEDENDFSGERYQYEDFTESYYSDEAKHYPVIEDLDFMEQDSFQEQVMNHDYFAEKTKHVREADKEKLSVMWRDQEVKRLCEVIRDLGSKDEHNQITVTFKALNQAYQNIATGLEGLLVRAKTQRRVDYHGDFLLVSEDGDVVITLLADAPPQPL